MAEEDHTEFVDPFRSDGDGEADIEGVAPDDEEYEVVDVSQEKIVPDPAALAAIPGLMRASDLLPPETEDESDEVPPTPEEADLQSLPLAERERIKLARMTPEQRMRYGMAQIEIESHPAVKEFMKAEAHHVEKTEAYRQEYLKAMKAKKERKP